ncbi:MAG: hypothetical protein Aurels2KO_40170 [Aureliella sp.]
MRRIDSRDPCEHLAAMSRHRINRGLEEGMADLRIEGSRACEAITFYEYYLKTGKTSGACASN